MYCDYSGYSSIFYVKNMPINFCFWNLIIWCHNYPTNNAINIVNRKAILFISFNERKKMIRKKILKNMYIISHLI